MNLKLIISTLAMLTTTCMGQGLGTGIDRANMDLKAKPGTDFFQYSGGGWMAANPLSAEHSRYGHFNKLNETNQERLRDIILELSKQQGAEGSLEQKIGGLYRLAMDSARLNAEGYAPIRKLLEEIYGTKTKKELFMLQSRLSHYGVPGLISTYCGADDKNAKQNIVQIFQPQLTLGERSFYLEQDDAMQQIRTAYGEYMTSLFELTGDEKATAQKKAEAILKLETRQAESNYSNVQLRNPEANYHKMSYADLLNDFPGIDWSTYFIFEGYPAFTEVVVGQIEPIHALEKLYEETSLEDLKAFVAFRLIDDAAGYLSDNFREASFNFYGKTLQGSQEDRPRWKRAVSTVDQILGEAVGKIYVERYFPESSKTRMKELVNQLAIALGERIDAQDWMSDATKQKAHEKLSTFYVKIGYPDKWTDYSSLVIDESKSYYENIMAAAGWRTNDHIAKRVNKPVDRDEWLMTPQTINAYYNPTTNEICFPAGILQPPFFNPEADDAANYGAIGVVIGHEMTHGFDDQGCKYDKDGNLNNWWTAEDSERFKERTAKMIKYFDKLEALPGLKCNGELTVGENLADHGGLMVAHQAFHNAMRTNPLKTADGFTPDQRFFLSYGLIWANNAREESIRQLTKTDPHSLGRWRVNGALPHIDAWYKAFNIKKGAPLYVAPKDRVVVW